MGYMSLVCLLSIVVDMYLINHYRSDYAHVVMDDGWRRVFLAMNWAWLVFDTSHYLVKVCHVFG